LEEAESIELTQQDRKSLLRVARSALEAHLEPESAAPGVELNPALEQDASAFVTLHQDGELRGCVGTLDTSCSLHETVAAMAIAAAVRDPRFPPLGAAELDRTTIEISVLGAPRPVEDPDQIRIGEHGLTIELDGRRGLLLPQVASERGWSVHSFLEQLCRKANLPAEAWRHPEARVTRFTADVFHEPAAT